MKHSKKTRRRRTAQTFFPRILRIIIEKTNYISHPPVESILRLTISTRYLRRNSNLNNLFSMKSLRRVPLGTQLI